MINKTNIEMINKLVWVLHEDKSVEPIGMGPFTVITTGVMSSLLSASDYLDFISSNLTNSDFSKLKDNLFKTGNYNRLVCCLCLFNSNPKFIELIKDTQNTYKDSNITYQKASSSNIKDFRSYINEYIDYINKPINKEFIISYLSNWGYIDDYLNALNDIEKLCYIICAMVAEVDALDTHYRKSHGWIS